MEEILLPHSFEYSEIGNPNEGVLTVEPCYPGYGTTLGNTLRRVLLSSLPGAAVTGVKIKGAQHEFTTLPNLKEDVLDILLNLKLLRFRIHGEFPQGTRLTLSVKGEKKVTAKEIEAPSNIEIVNPNLHIATLTNKDASLDMEIFIDRGRGYSPTEERPRDKYEIGTMLVDALFSPIRNVNARVENVRVGQITNYDKLTLLVESDGSISPKEAIAQAAQILMDHLLLFTKVDNVSPAQEEKEESVAVMEEGGEVEPAKKRGRPKKSV